MHISYFLIISIVIVAFLYSIIGHGGASGYLAVMAIIGFEPQLMRSSALLLNLIVSAIAFIQYYRKGYFKWKLFYPFAVTSIPASFIGGMILINADDYKIILGVCLMAAVFRMLIISKYKINKKEISIYFALFIGAVIGFASGVIGIGGGILLSPILLLMHLADMKETAAISALFIFVNSAAGLIGIWSAGDIYIVQIWVLVTAAAVGGLLGSYTGSSKLQVRYLRFILSIVLLFASLKLIIFN